MIKVNTKHINKPIAQAGFTLIELLLVVALMSISFGITSDMLLTIMRSFNKSTVMTEIEQQANFTGLKIEKELRNASAITLDSATKVTFIDLSGTSYSYEVNNNVLYRYLSSSGTPRTATTAVSMNSTAAGQAVSGGVNVACVGACFAVIPGSPTIVNLNMEFSQAQAALNSSYSGKVSLKSTIVARNTYN